MTDTSHFTFLAYTIVFFRSTLFTAALVATIVFGKGSWEGLTILCYYFRTRKVHDSQLFSLASLAWAGGGFAGMYFAGFRVLQNYYAGHFIPEITNYFDGIGLVIAYMLMTIQYYVPILGMKVYRRLYWRLAGYTALILLGGLANLLFAFYNGK
jgi:hypothetical protein